MADQRILSNTAAVLSWQPTDHNGEPAAPSGTVTVEVTRADGTEVKAAETATDGTGAAPRTVTLTAAEVGDLGLLTATWSDDDSSHTTTAEIVGGFYFTIGEARAADSHLANEERYPNEAILTARTQVEDDFERICDVAFVPRYRRERVTGALLPTPKVRRVVSVRDYSDATNYTAWPDSDLAGILVDGVVLGGYRSFTCYGSRVIEWEHGYDRPPGAIKAKALQYLLHRLNENATGIPDRATSFSVTEGGTYELSTAGPYSVGVPEIDAELQRWSERVPGMA